MTTILMEKTEPEIFLGFAEETKEDLSTQFPDRLDGKIGGKPLSSSCGLILFICQKWMF